MKGPILSVDAFTADLEPSPLDAADIVSGSPAVQVAELTAIDGVEIGIWQITAGTVTDVEVDEVFVVLSGRGEVQLGDDTVVALAAGTVVRLHAGERTTWTIAETLRKIYVALPTHPPHGTPATSEGTS